ncbi:hypothetical protein GT347_16285 [Xylophilus rhododendri]|uniref:Cytochrome P450 n=1 Tax=Xylophilus rhododendri TaxID=2697032 RepID=A0A857J8M4_9BURK|nr:hypothetical protein [Xylophilus rhododendri]QHI99399.1 hypothetical protein GT347_16285 [Xylophilus rhododendri]
MAYPSSAAPTVPTFAAPGNPPEEHFDAEAWELTPETLAGLLQAGGEQVGNMLRLMSTSVAQILRRTPDRGEAVVKLGLPGGVAVHIVRSLNWESLAASLRLDRDSSHRLSQEAFGNAVFVASYRHVAEDEPEAADAPPLDAATQAKVDRLKRELRKHANARRDLKAYFGEAQVRARAPRLAQIASAAVDGILASPPDQAVDMDLHILNYLFATGAEAMTGRAVDLSRHAETFRRSIATMAATVGSPWKSTLGALNQGLARFLARHATRARGQLHEMARDLAGAALGQAAPNLVVDIVRMHGFVPAGVTPEQLKSEDFQPVLDDIAMEFAATVFTTSSLMMLVLNHFIARPAELQALRQQLEQDFPQGVQGVEELYNLPSTRALFLAFLGNLPINVAARGAVEDIRYTDSDGQEHLICAGDAVLFDLPTLQRKCLGPMRELLENAGPQAALFDFLDLRRNGGLLPMFFSGPTMCPGRYTGIFTAARFLLELLHRCELSYYAGGEVPVNYGVVNRLGGDPRMRVEARDRWFDAEEPWGCPAMQAQLHELLWGAPGLSDADATELEAAALPPPPAAAPACPMRPHPLPL